MRGFISVGLFVALTSQALAQPQGGPPSEPPTEAPKPDEPKAPSDPTPTPSKDPAPTTTPPAIATDKPIESKIDQDQGRLAPLVPVKDLGLRFGSYGRIIAGTDLRGGKPESVNVVAHGPRIVEPSYLELDFSYGLQTPRGYTLRPVITLAFDGTLFHDTGEFDAHPALRNMYLDAQLTKTVSAWVGSRMYRGDDIYLFDYWPLDDQNTLGGGVFFRKREAENSGDSIEIAAHAGVNRLLNDFQYQEVDVLDPAQGATTVVQLNRQRMVASTSVTYILAGDDNINIKAKVHAEAHALPSGTRKRESDGTLENLPSDSGYVIGAEVGAFGFAPESSGYRRHANLFMRYARGLAAFDELAPPTSFGFDLTTSRASELSFGLSGNWDTKLGNLLVGALSRRFVDSDAPGSDYDDGWEYALAARPLLRVPGMPDLFAGGDVSYQARFPKGLNPTTQRAQDPSVFQIAPMLVFSPMGPSGYDRPQLRLVYRVAFLNQAAQDLYAPDDQRAGHSVVHFLGFQAEWWFNSSTYR